MVCLFVYTLMSVNSKKPWKNY